MAQDLQTVSAMSYLQADHRRLDQLMARCQEAVQQGRLTEAAGLFSEFRHGLSRHIKIEEELLFPAFEEATGLDRAQGPTGVMRKEHIVIVRLLGLIQDGFAESRIDLDGFMRLRRELGDLLRSHNEKEEHVIYPMTDSQVPSDRLAALVGRMRSF